MIRYSISARKQDEKGRAIWWVIMLTKELYWTQQQCRSVVLLYSNKYWRVEQQQSLQKEIVMVRIPTVTVGVSSGVAENDPKGAPYPPTFNWEATTTPFTPIEEHIGLPLGFNMEKKWCRNSNRWQWFGGAVWCDGAPCPGWWPGGHW